MTTGSVLAQFTITLSQAVSEQVAVEWHTADGTALAGVDYAAAKGTVLFAPGQTAKTVDILVHGRAVGSEDRSFFVEMLPPVNAILGASIGECIIHVDTTGSTPVTQIIVPTGPQGPEGKSAYQTWLDLGNTGTEQDFIDSLSPSPEEIAEDVAPLIDVGDTVLTAEGTEGLSKPDETTVKAVARRVAYVGAAKIATVVLADGDNLISQSDLTGDTVDMGSVGLYPRIMRGASILSPQWSIAADGRLLIKSAVAGDVLYVCQYDVASWSAVTRLSFEALRRSYAEAGCDLIGTFSDTGLVVNTATDVVLWGPTGIAYAYSGTLPHTVGAGETPADSWQPKDAVTIKTVLSSPGGSGGIGFTQDATGAVSQTVEGKLEDWLSVGDFGPIAADGLTNDTPTFAKAQANGKPYLVPPGTYKVTSIFSGLAYSFGNVSFTGDGAVSITNLAAAVVLPSRGAAYIVTDGGKLRPPKHNHFSNPTFFVWPNADWTTFDTFYKSNVPAGAQPYVCGNWIIKSHATCVVSAIRKIGGVSGGLQGTVTFDATPDFMYVRQLIPNIMQFSGRTYTMSVDIEVDAPVQADFYIQARKNANDADRILVVDTENVQLVAGRQRVACTFTVPDLASFEAGLDKKNSLESAFRLNGQSSVVNFKIREIILEPGVDVTAGCQADIAKSVADVEVFYEVGGVYVVGLNPASGQKRVTAQIKSRKKEQIIASNVQVYDVVGNPGKVSTYDAAGNRTDNVVVTGLTVDSNGVTAIINASIAAGIGFTYIVNINY